MIAKAPKESQGWRVASPSVPAPGVELVLDLSRLISRALHATPTGVDRVELAYARELQRLAGDRLSYAALHPTGIYGRLPTRRALRFIQAVEAMWTDGGKQAGVAGRAGRWRSAALDRARGVIALRPAPVPAKRAPRVFIQSSPHHLHRFRVTRAMLAREDAGFVCLLHDLIPIQFPEYARPGGAAKHLRRVRTVAALADAVIANSATTAEAFRPYLVDAKREYVPVTVAHLGLDALAGEASETVAVPAPYFVMIGTIEPRKNHLLLLHLWRDLAERLPAAKVPRLVLVGRRGWENEQVVDMLERCSALAVHVEEHSNLPDRSMAALLRGAAGLLLPSFAEGYGMPVPEALAAGVPVICSDIPALREAGGSAPDYLDPLDGPAWRAAIMALADQDGSARSAHLARMRHWRAPTWKDHLITALSQAEQVAR